MHAVKSENISRYACNRESHVVREIAYFSRDAYRRLSQGTAARASTLNEFNCASSRRTLCPFDSKERARRKAGRNSNPSRKIVSVETRRLCVSLFFQRSALKIQMSSVINKTIITAIVPTDEGSDSARRVRVFLKYETRYPVLTKREISGQARRRFSRSVSDARRALIERFSISRGPSRRSKRRE